MRRRGAMGAVAALAAAAAMASGAGPAGAAVTPEQATALGREAYLYGFPLLEFLRVRSTATSVRCPDGRGNGPTNTFSNATRFTTPANRTVVAPNVDTLYSIAHLDLGRGPVVLSHPAMGRRYFSFQFLDPYTNTIGYVGRRSTGRRAGRFAITWSGRPGRRAAGTRLVRSPYRRVWVIGRTLATDRPDQRRAIRLMRRYRLTPPGGARDLTGCRPNRPREARTPAGLPFLAALGRALRDNPPPARDRPLLQRLAEAGIAPGRSPAQAGLAPDALRALVAGVDATAAALPDVARTTITTQALANQGWAMPNPIIGDYGIDYTFRAGVAAIGLGANTPVESVYPTGFGDAEGRRFDGASRYRLTFPPGQAPPARAFWSLTMYDEDGYLVANPQRRYAVGDSHPPLRRRPDGSIVVVLQRTAPAERDVNWLPTPPGRFRINLRLYLPERSVLNGTWRPPPVARVG